MLDKKTLIFDLDETLIHCNPTLDLPSDIVLPIRFDDGSIIRVNSTLNRLINIKQIGWNQYSTICY
jgi:FMN phosphatase YigB (HAD superfamily)